MRLRFDFSEAQNAVICELLLRGRQQPGELRTRASRMIRIDSQDHLKSELQGLAEKGFLQASDNLDRRGVEVDHTFYLPSEHMQLKQQPQSAETGPGSAEVPGRGSSPAVAPAHSQATAAAPAPGVLHELHEQQAALKQQLERLQNAVDSIRQRLDRIERELGLG
jgi:uncharacterized protein YceH (UPF0502 family)